MQISCYKETLCLKKVGLFFLEIGRHLSWQMFQNRRNLGEVCKACGRQDAFLKDGAS